MKFAARSIALLLSFALAACDSGTDPENGNTGTGNLRIEAELTHNRVAIAAQKQGHITSEGATDEGATADSLVITGASFMISEIKLQRKGAGLEEKVSTGPVILSVNQNGAKVVMTGSVPLGIYDKSNFRFHRLNDEEVQPWINDADFAGFVTPDRYTILVNGFVYTGGTAAPYSYGSKVEEDLKFELPEFTISETGQTVIVVQLETPEVFKDKDTGEVLDPRDPENQNRIDDAIKAALNTLRR